MLEHTAVADATACYCTVYSCTVTMLLKLLHIVNLQIVLLLLMRHSLALRAAHMQCFAVCTAVVARTTCFAAAAAAEAAAILRSASRPVALQHQQQHQLYYTHCMVPALMTLGSDFHDSRVIT
jgi:hypothetical protein